MKKFMVLLVLFLFLLSACSLTPLLSDEESVPNGNEAVSETESETEPLIPLLASNESENLYLYGINPVGAVLYSNGEGHYYDWVLADAKVSLYSGLFDYDDDRDIAIVSDIDDSMQDIRIISDGDFSPENVYTVIPDEFNSYIKSSVEHSFNEETKAVTFTVNGQNYIFDLSESLKDVSYKGIMFSKNVKYFMKDGKIYVTLIPVIYGEGTDGTVERTISELTLTSHLRFDGTHIALDETVVDGLL